MSVKSELGYPGTLSTALRDGQYPGNQARFFWSVDSYNRWFTEEPGKPGHGLLITDVQCVPYFFGLLIGVMVHFTKQLAPEEQEDFLEVSREIEFGMQERRRKRALAAEEANKVQAAAKAEVERLAAVGKKYEERVKHRATLSPGDDERKSLDKTLNAGDPDVLFKDKSEAFAAGFVHGARMKSEKEGKV